jgi:hypothetical protein
MTNNPARMPNLGAAAIPGAGIRCAGFPNFAIGIRQRPRCARDGAAIRDRRCRMLPSHPRRAGTLYASIYCRWVEQWLTASRSFEGLEIKFVTCENFVQDKPGYYTDVARFFDLNTEAVVSQLLKIEPKKKVVHYRKARLDEWRETLNDAEQDLFRSLMEPSLFAEFGWQP